MIFLTKQEKILCLFLLASFVCGSPLAFCLRKYPDFAMTLSFLERLSAPQPQDLNKVTFEDLTAMPAVGRTMAERIIRYRMAEGEFYSVEDLKKISGLDSRVFERMRPYLTVK